MVYKTKDVSKTKMCVLSVMQHKLMFLHKNKSKTTSSMFGASFRVLRIFWKTMNHHSSCCLMSIEHLVFALYSL